MTISSGMTPQRPVLADVSHDAVVMVPGIMGSELVDAYTRDTLWGMRDLRWYVRAWTTGAGLRVLRLTDEERNGRYGRIKANRLLRFPAFARVLGGLEPYTKLVQQIRSVVAHDDAVLEFAYDWRLPVRHNAALLAEAARTHLGRWRAHPTCQRAVRRHSDGRPAQLVFVAHSMGGLLVRCLALIPGASDDTRVSVTLGTPFYGSIKATTMLNTGRGGPPLPLPRTRPLSAMFRPFADEGLRALAASLPAVHDLLPTYRCVDEQDSARRLTVADVVTLGGDADLAIDSANLHERLDGISLIGHRTVVGVAQPTWQSMVLRDGVVHPQHYACEGEPHAPVRVDRLGDGTVYRESAGLRGATHTYLPQQHGSLAKTDEVIAIVTALITEKDPDAFGPPMAAGDIGLDAPDMVVPHEEQFATITGIAHPRAAHCRVIDLTTGRVVAQPSIEIRDGTLGAVLTFGEPGLYRVEVAGNGAAPISQMTLVADPDLSDQEASKAPGQRW